jgi:pterin-4a-carbinolamine dehydratase
MKRLQNLHEEFIDAARRPMNFGRLPIKPVEGDVAIIPVDRWEKTKDPARMRKTFRFSSIEARNRFVRNLLGYEVETRHNAVLTVEEGLVMVNLFTKDVNRVTELDKEYAEFADVLYKDIVYGLVNE